MDELQDQDMLISLSGHNLLLFSRAITTCARFRDEIQFIVYPTELRIRAVPPELSDWHLAITFGAQFFDAYRPGEWVEPQTEPGIALRTKTLATIFKRPAVMKENIVCSITRSGNGDKLAVYFEWQPSQMVDNKVTKQFKMPVHDMEDEFEVALLQNVNILTAHSKIWDDIFGHFWSDQMDIVIRVDDEAVLFKSFEDTQIKGPTTKFSIDSHEFEGLQFTSFGYGIGEFPLDPVQLQNSPDTPQLATASRESQRSSDPRYASSRPYSHCRNMHLIAVPLKMLRRWLFLPTHDGQFSVEMHYEMSESLVQFRTVSADFESILSVRKLPLNEAAVEYFQARNPSPSARSSSIGGLTTTTSGSSTTRSSTTTSGTSSGSTTEETEDIQEPEESRETPLEEVLRRNNQRSDHDEEEFEDEENHLVDVDLF